ncbi:radical SAM protein [Clostridium thermosuccinogenes]|uniref:radical SAM protein n=1 Tax=Clostridium thermosuccinogenes TaxID=84032 RepID=UPI000CCBDBB9|nr:radical SAM protein [Pseudoclostridium thermosuccinogenes]PNT92022.1 hypothetical protein CDQ83_00080 [Pseudoclostridium thermosuccinogenes]
MSNSGTFIRGRNIFDAFILGEGEDVIHEILDVYLHFKGHSKRSILLNLSRIKGVFVPSIQDLKKPVLHVSPVNISNRPAHSIFLSKDTVYEEETFTIEVRRGCNQKCRFCYMGTRLRPARTISFGAFKRTVDLGLSHCQIIKCFYEGLPTSVIEEYLSYIEKKGGRLRVGSQRLEMLSERIIEMMARAGQRKLVIAPESSERLRKVIGKERIKNEDIIKYLNMASEKGIHDIGLYFIIGLPGETHEDLDEISNIIFTVRQHMNELGNKNGYLEVGINPLFPKPFTAFQYAAATYPEEAEKKLDYILGKLREFFPVQISNDVVDEKVEKPKEHTGDDSVIKIETTIGSTITFSQPILSRGDERIGDVLLDMLDLEDTIDNWKQTLKSHGLIASDYFRSYLFAERLPWDFQKCSVSTRHLISEYNLALEMEPSSPCTTNCSTCLSSCMV